MYNHLSSSRVQFGLQLSLVGLASLLVFLSNVVLARAEGPGDLDPTFNGTGVLTTAVTTSTDAPNSVIIQPDGKILAAGYSNNPNNVFTLVRYTPTGQLDLTFNMTGIVTTAVGNRSNIYAVTLQPDQKIVVAGVSEIKYFALARYDPDGKLDPTFNGTGIVTTSLGIDPSTTKAITIQPDGPLVVAGIQQTGSDHYLALAHYQNNGALDPDFYGTGLITTPLDIPPNSVGTQVVFQPDDKVLVAGYTYEMMFITRYTPEGNLDTTFNGTGLVTTTVSGSNLHQVMDIALQPDGKIIIAGAANQGGSTFLDTMVARYNPDGSLDSTFKGTGIITTPLGSRDDGSFGVTVQPNGKIISGGAVNRIPGGLALSVVRYESNGDLDTSFKGTGIVTTSISTELNFPSEVLLQPDGKIILIGYVDSPSTDLDFFAIRYLGDPQPVLTPSLTLHKQVNVSLAEVGQQITYTYRLTNSGDITLTGLTAQDNLLGPVPLTTTTLAPNASLDARLSYTPTAADLSSALVNTITITGLAAGHPPVIVTATTIVTVQDTLPPIFPITPLITPTKGVTLTQFRPRFRWQPATDNTTVLSYTLLLTRPAPSLQAIQVFTTTRPAYTPTANLSPGRYLWTVQAHDLTGNTATSALAHFIIVAPQQRLYLPVLIRN